MDAFTPPGCTWVGCLNGEILQIEGWIFSSHALVVVVVEDSLTLDP